MPSLRNGRVALGVASLVVLGAVVACHETITTPTAQPETSAHIIYGSMVLGGNDSTYRLSRTPLRKLRVGGARRSLSAAAADPFTFDMLLRLSAEQQAWIVFPEGGTAYFRDAAIEFDQTLTGSHDGETYRTDIIHPNGFVETGTNTVYRNTDPANPCFSIGITSLCGSDVVYEWTRIETQCAQTGNWTLKMYHDGALVRTVAFVIKPTLPPGTVSLMNQGDPAWKDLHYDNSCYGPGGNSIVCPGLETDRKKTIGNKGCAITAASMMLGYFGVPTTPDQLNTWFETNHLYDEPGGTDFTVLGRYAREQTDTTLTWDARYTGIATVREKICRFGPQVLEVRSLSGNAQHFVLAVGMTDDGSDVIVNDPNGGVQRNLVATYGSFRSTRTLIGKARADTLSADNGNIIINFHSPGHLVVTDPAGRRLGYDPIAGRMYAEIPGSYYDTAAALSSVNPDGTFSDDEPDPPKHLELHGAAAGAYTVDVSGTGTGTYQLDITGYDAALGKHTTIFADVPITPGEVHSYRFSYDVATAGLPGGLKMSGSFSGGGQSASSDELLSYSRPAQRQTTVAAGATSYSMMIFYGTGLTPSTFGAVLNGVDVGAMFHPTPGGSETVVIPLAAGRNVLKLSAKGTVGTRSTSDADQLVFKVP